LAFVEISRAETMAEFQGALLAMEGHASFRVADKGKRRDLRDEEVLVAEMK
jgi:hypothetical protein